MVKNIKSKVSMEFKKFFFRKNLKKMEPGFWNISEFGYEKKNIEKICIDLRNTDHAHLGDQLFFISAFLGYNRKKVIFIINESLAEFYDCYDVTYSVGRPQKIDEKCLYVCSLKSYIDPMDSLMQQFENRLVYDLTDSAIKIPLYKHIFEALTGDIGYNIEMSNANTFSLHETETTLSNFGLQSRRFYVFNDFLYSRSFMRPLLQGALMEKLEEVKNDGFIICYVGGKNDATLKSNLLSYVNLDLRGKTSFRDLLAIIGSDNCNGYIGFDNALMHIHLLYRKYVFVKFRGRLTSKARILHFNSINCAMNAQAKDKIVYL